MPLRISTSHVRMPEFKFWLHSRFQPTDNVPWNAEGVNASSWVPANPVSRSGSRFWPGLVQTLQAFGGVPVNARALSLPPSLPPCLTLSLLFKCKILKNN